jgi:hypothetical protein
MATRRSTRVTNVDPWIAGGEGQLRDLFPLPPWLFLAFRAIATAARHFLITATLLAAIYLWIAKDWNWWQAFLIFPFTIYLLRSTIITAWLWFKNPTIPLIARKR